MEADASSAPCTPDAVLYLHLLPSAASTSFGVSFFDPAAYHSRMMFKLDNPENPRPPRATRWLASQASQAGVGELLLLLRHDLRRHGGFPGTQAFENQPRPPPGTQGCGQGETSLQTIAGNASSWALQDEWRSSPAAVPAGSLSRNGGGSSAGTVQPQPTSTGCVRISISPFGRRWLGSWPAARASRAMEKRRNFSAAGRRCIVTLAKADAARLTRGQRGPVRNLVHTSTELPLWAIFCGVCSHSEMLILQWNGYPNHTSCALVPCRQMAVALVGNGTQDAIPKRAHNGR